MDQLENSDNKKLQLETELETIGFIIMGLTEYEQLIGDFRNAYRESLHPWAMPSLTNAIGSIQHAISDLKHAKHHIETPEPEIDASLEITK